MFDSASLSSLNISTDTTSKNKSQFECNDTLFANFAIQLHRFQLDYGEHDENESNDRSTDKDQNDENIIVNKL